MATNKNISQILNNLPLIFEKNIGQYDDLVKFVSKQNKCTTYFLNNDVVISLANNKEGKNEVNSLRISLENCNKNCEILGINKLDCKVIYFKGATEKEWIKDVPVYEKIIYKEIYPSIDLVYYSNEEKLKHDFIIKPNANPNNIKFTFDGADNINIDNEGNLEIQVKENIIKILKPITYQEINSNHINIDNNFIIENNNVKFQIEQYDKENILIIDPQILYSTLLGGVANNDIDNSLAIDDEENAYVLGSTTTTPEEDAYLVKIDTKKKGISSLIYFYYLGGNSRTKGHSVALDKYKNVYITGWTGASDFPTVDGFQMAPLGSCATNSYLTKIDNSASTILYSTYIGGYGT